MIDFSKLRSIREKDNTIQWKADGGTNQPEANQLKLMRTFHLPFLFSLKLVRFQVKISNKIYIIIFFVRNIYI